LGPKADAISKGIFTLDYLCLKEYFGAIIFHQFPIKRKEERENVPATQMY
jgi:hypothetical protein